MRGAILFILTFLTLSCTSCQKKYTCVCEGNYFMSYSDVKGFNESDAKYKCQYKTKSYTPEEDASCSLK